MEKTAVEFLSETFGKHFGTGWLVDETIKKEIEQAKEMEAQQKGYSEDQVKQAITNFYMNDLLLTEENLTKVINDLKQKEQ